MASTLGASSSRSIVRVRVGFHGQEYDKRHYPKLDNYASSGLGFLKKLASVVCFMDPVEDLRPLMVVVEARRRRAAFAERWRRGSLSRPARGVGSRRLAAAQRRLAGVF